MEKANVLMYKGYYTKIVYDREAKMMTGIIEDINDLVYFESKNADEIEKEFHHAVDHYLEHCNANGLEPNKAYKGSFNVRIDTDLHKKLANFSFRNGKSLNSIVEEAIRVYINGDYVWSIRNIEDNCFTSTSSLEINNKSWNEWKKDARQSTPLITSSSTSFQN